MNQQYWSSYFMFGHLKAMTIYYIVLSAPSINVKLSQNQKPIASETNKQAWVSKFTSFAICWCSKARCKLHIGPEHARDLFKVCCTQYFTVRNPQSTMVNLSAQSAFYGHLRNCEQWWAKDPDGGLPEGQRTCQLLSILSRAWLCWLEA